MKLETWLALTLVLVMEISGVEGISDISQQDYVVAGTAGSNSPSIEDQLRTPTIVDQLRSGELSIGERPPTIGDKIAEASKSNLHFDEETGLLDIKKDWPSGATYHDVLSYGEQKSDAYQLVVIGDSIAWGNGLEQKDKYYNKVAEDLRKALKRPVEITVYAHSGAKISTAGESTEEMLFRATGSLPDGNLNKGGPTLMEQAAKISNDADLILVSGGINDVGALSTINPNIPEDNMRKRTEEKIKEPIAELLTNILHNTKADAKIIVTGYYQIASDDTTMESQDGVVTSAAQFPAQLHTGLANAVKYAENNKNGDALRASNSKAFYDASTISLQDAVDNANKVDNDRGRVVFVDPNLGSTNSYGASEPSLWELNPDGTSNDDQRNERSIVVAQNGGNPITKYENEINAIGHPNKKGASQYEDAIMETITKSKGIDWLLGQEQESKFKFSATKPNQLSGTQFPGWMNSKSKAASGLESWGKHPKGWGVSQEYVNAHPEIYGYPSPTPGSQQSGSNSGSSAPSGTSDTSTPDTGWIEEMIRREMADENSDLVKNLRDNVNGG